MEEKQKTIIADWVTKPQTHRNMQTQEIIEDYRQNLTKGNQSQLVKEASRIALCVEKTAPVYAALAFGKICFAKKKQNCSAKDGKRRLGVFTKKLSMHAGLKK